MSKFKPQVCPFLWGFHAGIPQKLSISSCGSFNNPNSCMVRSTELLDSHTSHRSLAFVNWKAFSLVYFRASIPLCPQNTCSFLDLGGQEYCRAEGCSCSTRRRGARLGHPSKSSISVKRVLPARWHTWFLTLQNQGLKPEGCPAMARGRFCYSMWSPSFPKLVKEHLWHQQTELLRSLWFAALF